MNWIPLRSVDQLAQIRTESAVAPVMIFKHSTSCSISRTVLDRLQRNWKDQAKELKIYFLDLFANREVSNQVEHLFGITHESPQVLIIDNGQAVFHRSHFEIDWLTISKFLASASIKN